MSVGSGVLYLRSGLRVCGFRVVGFEIYGLRVAGLTFRESSASDET